jgi:AcrR family transcriptional regulator
MGAREDLLRGARRCIEEKGYARTTARDIVAASGTNLASIGYHFGSKEALLNEAIGAAFEEWTEHLIEVGVEASTDDPMQRLTASMIAMLDEFGKNRALEQAFVEAIAQAERSPELRAQMAGQYATSREAIAESVRDALGDGIEEAGVDPKAIASYLMAVCDGLVLQSLVDPDAIPTGEELVASLAGAVGLMMGAAAPEPAPEPAA